MCENCKALRAELRGLRQQLGMEADRALVMALARYLKLPTMEAMMLAALYSSKRALTADRLMEVVNSESRGAVATHISRIRARLGKECILPSRPRTYLLTGVGRQTVEHALQQNRVATEVLMNTETVNIPTAMAILAGRLAYERGAEAAIEATSRIASQLEAHRG